MLIPFLLLGVQGLRDSRIVATKKEIFETPRPCYSHMSYGLNLGWGTYRRLYIYICMYIYIYMYTHIWFWGTYQGIYYKFRYDSYKVLFIGVEVVRSPCWLSLKTVRQTFTATLNP